MCETCQRRLSRGARGGWGIHEAVICSLKNVTTPGFRTKSPLFISLRNKPKTFHVSVFLIPRFNGRAKRAQRSAPRSLRTTVLFAARSGGLECVILNTVPQQLWPPPDDRGRNSKEVDEARAPRGGTAEGVSNTASVTVTSTLSSVPAPTNLRIPAPLAPLSSHGSFNLTMKRNGGWTRLSLFLTQCLCVCPIAAAGGVSSQ